MQWDGLTLKTFAGVAAVIASGALLLAGIGLVVPMMGLVAGVRRDGRGQPRPPEALRRRRPDQGRPVGAPGIEHGQACTYTHTEIPSESAPPNPRKSWSARSRASYTRIT
jgi:hypothetical protein